MEQRGTDKQPSRFKGHLNARVLVVFLFARGIFILGWQKTNSFSLTCNMLIGPYLGNHGRWFFQREGYVQPRRPRPVLPVESCKLSLVVFSLMSLMLLPVLVVECH